MGSIDKFREQHRKFAIRFLHSAVVVDDEAHMEPDWTDASKGEVEAPKRLTSASRQSDPSPVGRSEGHSLNARSIMDSFAALGVICGVVGPPLPEMEMMRQADIVVLDWLLKDGKPQYSLSLLRKLLTGGMDRNALRLVAIYTGEAALEDIYGAVFSQLEKDGLYPEDNGSRTSITYRHGRVVLYAKSGVKLVPQLKDRIVSEKALPDRLVKDFSTMTEGLLPRIALTSLTSVREGSHMVLDRFRAGLDPALIAHRACLDNPDDAERQIVNHVAEELRGLMDNAVAEQHPAGGKEVEEWVRHRNREDGRFVFGGKPLDLEQTIKLAKEGLEASNLKDKAFEVLSAGFADSGVAGLDKQVDKLDKELAWIMSYRTLFKSPEPILWLGSVVTAMDDDEERHLLCMKPRCDCVRLDRETSFFFLPLVEPPKGKKKLKNQLVVKLDKDFKRLGIALDSAGWVCRQFKPSMCGRGVTATQQNSVGVFFFTDTCNKRYTWQGELKAEFAQRIAQTFTTTLSRVAVDESEWLRRMAK